MYLSGILPLCRPVHPPAIHLTYVGRRIKPARERYKLFQDRNEDRFDVVLDPNRDLRASGERSKASFTLADVIDQLQVFDRNWTEQKVFPQELIDR